MFLAILLFAAKGGGDPLFFFIAAPILILVALIAMMREANATYVVTIKRGLPYCTNCNRQVSYRRDYCRGCGQRFKFYGPPKDQVIEESDRARAEREAFRAGIARQIQAAEVAARERRERHNQERIKKREAREEYYRSRGIEPGPWAWFQALPEFVQPILIGLAIAAPVLILALVVVVLRRETGPSSPRPQPSPIVTDSDNEAPRF